MKSGQLEPRLRLANYLSIGENFGKKSTRLSTPFTVTVSMDTEKTGPQLRVI